MGFYIYSRSIRDTAPHKKILDLIVVDPKIACFIVNEEGKIVVFNDTLSFHIQVGFKFLARKPYEDVLEILNSQKGGPQGDPHHFDEKFSVREFRNFGKKGSLLMKHYPLGHLPSPVAIYFLSREEFLPSEKEISTTFLPYLSRMADKLQRPVGNILMGNHDAVSIDKLSQGLLTTLPAAYQLIRVFMADATSMSDSSHFIRMGYEGPPESMRQSTEGVLYGDTVYFRTLSASSIRPALVAHSDQLWKHEVLLPCNWYLHVFAWIGIPLLSFDVWKEPLRIRWQEMVAECAFEMGEFRSKAGLIPFYQIDEQGLFNRESLVLAMEHMIAQSPVRPFSMILFRLKFQEIQNEFIDFLQKARRSSDLIGKIDEGIIMIYPDVGEGVSTSVEIRYKGILERLSLTDYRFQCAISKHSFPSSNWTGEELLVQLIKNESLQVKPLEHADKEIPQFEDWFKRFLLLKDFD